MLSAVWAIVCRQNAVSLRQLSTFLLFFLKKPHLFHATSTDCGTTYQFRHAR